MTELPKTPRELLKEFRRAESLFGQQLKNSEAKESAQLAELKTQTEAAKKLVARYRQQINGKNQNFPSLLGPQISEEMGSQFERLKDVATVIQQEWNKFNKINDRLKLLQKELEETFDQEKEEQKRLEKLRLEALQREIAARKKRIVRRTVLTIATVCILIAWHFWLLSKTTLSFGVMIDGNPSADVSSDVMLDGKPFASASKISLGHHRLTIELQDIEPFQKDIWIFYGGKNLGTIHLERSKGAVDLSAIPIGATFELSGMGQHWSGKLPTYVPDVPVGTYQLMVNRNGWKTNQTLNVSRKITTTNTTEFPYGSIEITSEPAGLTISTNGEVAGVTPAILQEIKPGRYTIDVSDGENDLTADIDVGPKESAKHVFIFHYGNAQLFSTPTGATVFRKGKEIGKTPLMLDRLPVGKTTVELRLVGYASTNFAFAPREGITTDYTVKLFSTRYLDAMTQAQNALYSDQFIQASNFIAIALQAEPSDLAATALLKNVTQKAEETRQQQLAAERRAAEEKARAEAAAFAALPVLDPSALINDCWNPNDRESSDNLNRAVVAPVEGAVNIIFKPFDVLRKAEGNKSGMTQQVNNDIRFNMAQFNRSWKGKTMVCEGVVDSVQAKENIVVFKEIGSYPRQVRVKFFLLETSERLQQLKKNDALKIVGVISTLDAPEMMTVGVNQLVLKDGHIYPTITEAGK